MLTVIALQVDFGGFIFITMLSVIAYSIKMG